MKWILLLYQHHQGGGESSLVPTGTVLRRASSGYISNTIPTEKAKSLSNADGSVWRKPKIRLAYSSVCGGGTSVCANHVSERPTVASGGRGRACQRRPQRSFSSCLFQSQRLVLLRFIYLFFLIYLRGRVRKERIFSPLIYSSNDHEGRS